MRSIITLSTTAETKKNLQKRAKRAKMSLSAYVMQALERDSEYISEEELIEYAQKTQKDHKNKRTQKMKSLEDLMN